MVTALASKVKRVFHYILRVHAEPYNNWDSVRPRFRTSSVARKTLHRTSHADDTTELGLLNAWKAHTLTGDQKGQWSLSVTRNRRLTFRVDAAEREICDVNLEDYH
jgi:plasmid maintenance system killer protein